jgi:hypothetical protein
MSPIRRLAILTLSLIALAALGASPATAAGVFEATEYNASLAGAQTAAHTLQLGEVKVQCETATLSGELTGQLETVSLTPAYAGCTWLGSPVTIAVNSCQYVFAISEEKAENEFAGTTNMSCPKSSTITVSLLSGSCQAQIASQTGLSSVIYKDNLASSPPTVTLEENAKSLKYTVTTKGFCFPGTGEKTDGSLTGNSLVKGTSGGVGVGIAAEQRLPTKLCSAEPVGATVACPAGKAYGASTVLAGTAVAEFAKLIQIHLMTAGKFIEEIRCEKSTLSATSSAAEGTPLTMLSVFVAYTGCKAFGTGTTCAKVEMLSPSTGKLFAAGRLTKGGGNLEFPMTVLIECGMQIKCEFTTNLQTVWFEVASGLQARMGPSRPPYAGVAIPGEVGCTETIRFSTNFPIAEPKPGYITH